MNCEYAEICVGTCFYRGMNFIDTPINKDLATRQRVIVLQNYTNMPKMLPLRHIFIPTLTKHGKRSLSTPRLLPGRRTIDR
ncbi:MAG: hypothetical protein JWQ38_2203 [Flavipsychrobacter sp.]|nr:hypothetical protein [Flavipsychrobacter sp.]